MQLPTHIMRLDTVLFRALYSEIHPLPQRGWAPADLDGSDRGLTVGAHDTAGLSALPSLVTVKESTLSLTTIHYKGFPGVFLNGRD